MVVAVLFYCAVAFFLRPLRPPPPAAASGAAPAALLIAAFATLAVWVAQSRIWRCWSRSDCRPGCWAAAQPPAGRLGAGGLILVGLLPLVALAANLAGRFDAGAGVWHDLVLMLADGQIGTTLALLGCLLAGAGVAIVAAAGTVGGRPRSREPEMQIDRPGEISVRRQDGAGEPTPDEPESGEDEEPESSEPAQPEPERDPRLWSKPRGWISPPPGRRRATPWPSTT